MPLAAITDEISQDFEYALDVMGEYNVQGAELRGLWGANIADLTDAQVERAKNALHTRGLPVVCLATPFFKCDLPREANPDDGNAGPLHLAPPRPFADQMELLTRCIRLANAFDTRFLRVFSFWRKDALTPQLEERIVEAFAEPVALAEREGVTLVLENEHACYLGTGAEAARVASEINSPAFRLVWDPGNAFHAGELPFPDGYEAVKPYMAHMHIKDARLVETPDSGPQPQWCVIGEGEIDYDGQFAALRRDDYSGWISLETHYVPKTGSGPNGVGTPEDGSRQCLAALQKYFA